MADLEELKKMAEAATGAPWVADGDNVYHERLDEPGRHIASAYVSYRSDEEIYANAAFIAAARSAIPALIERVEAAEAVLKAYEAWEADSILNGDWDNSVVQMTQEQHDRMIEIQSMRNAALGRQS